MNACYPYLLVSIWNFQIAYLIAPCAHMSLNGEKIARIYWLGQRYDSHSKYEHFLFHPVETPYYKGQVLTAESFQNKSLIINVFIVLAAVVLQAIKWNSYSMLQALNRWPPLVVQYYIANIISSYIKFIFGARLWDQVYSKNWQNGLYLLMSSCITLMPLAKIKSWQQTFHQPYHTLAQFSNQTVTK